MMAAERQARGLAATAGRSVAESRRCSCSCGSANVRTSRCWAGSGISRATANRCWRRPPASCSADRLITISRREHHAMVTPVVLRPWPRPNTTRRSSDVLMQIASIRRAEWYDDKPTDASQITFHWECTLYRDPLHIGLTPERGMPRIHATRNRPGCLPEETAWSACVAPTGFEPALPP